MFVYHCMYLQCSCWYIYVVTCLTARNMDTFRFVTRRTVMYFYQSYRCKYVVCHVYIVQNILRLLLLYLRNKCTVTKLINNQGGFAVSRRSLTTEPCVRSQVISCGICRERSGTGTGFSPSTSVFRCQYHSFIYHRRYIILATVSVVK
jgi:hypothetical protein